MVRRACWPLGLWALGLIGQDAYAACRPWVEVRTDKIRAVSMLPEDRTLSVFDTLSRFERFVVGITGARDFTPSRPTLMVMFSRSAWNDYIPNARDIGGIFSTGLYENLIVVPEPAAAGRTAGARALAFNPYKSILHEFVHFVMFDDSSDYPLWYHEGMAEVLSDVSFNGEQLQYGVIQDYELETVRFTPDFDFGKFITDFPAHGSKVTDRSMQEHYAFAKVLVHYLSFGAPARRGQLQEYIRLLNAGDPAVSAFTAAFGVGFEAMHAELLEYAKQPAFLRGAVSWASLAGAERPRSAPLSCDDGMTESGFALVNMRSDPGKVAQGWFEAARKEVPDSQAPVAGLAWVAELSGDTGAADRMIESIAGSGKPLPVRWRNRMADLLRRRGEAADASEPMVVDQKRRIVALYADQAIDSDPEAAEAYGHLAYAQYHDDEVSDEGLAAARRVVELRPKDWYSALIAARGLESRGETDSAIYHWGIVRQLGSTPEVRQFATSRINELSR
jgi:hypothetical protein